MDSFQQRIVYLWYAFAFFIAPISDGLAPFVSVYLVAYADVSPGDAGLIWFARDISQMIFQVPMGAFVDYTTHKKTFLLFFTLANTLLPLIIIFTQSVPILLVKSVLEGFAGTSLRVFKGPFTLGISGHDNFEETAKHTEIFDHSGSLVACAIAGCIGYFLYPNVLPIFYVIGAFGCFATLAIALMTSDSTNRGIIDDDLARNSTHHCAYILEMLDASRECPPVEASGSETICNVENTKSKKEEPSDTTNEESGSKNIGNDENKKSKKDSSDSNEESEEVASTNSGDDNDSSSSLYTIFVEDRAMSFFSLAVFFFHLGNAAVLPVLGQVLALEDAKAGIPYTASNIVVAQLSSFLGIFTIEYFVKKGFVINIPIMIGFGSLIPRVIIILVVLHYSRNPYVLIATQVLDGIGAGVNGLAIMRVTKTLTEGTNRFGIVFSIVNVSTAVGAALSGLIAGYVIDFWSYEAGFYFLLSPGFLSVLFVYLTKVEPPALRGTNGD